MKVNVIGAGLAGSEAALQLAKRNIHVDLYEMRPEKSTGAHKTDKFAEFVCSNSLGASECTNASGLLKKESELLGCELIKIARACAVPAGNALAIDRELFSQTVTDKINGNSYINVIKEEVTQIPDGYTIVASGPLTSDLLAQSIKDFTQSEHLHFFDAIVTSEEARDEKPSAVPVQMIMDKLKVRTGEAAFIGDGYEKDVLGAVYSGLHPIWFKGDPTRAENATVIASWRDSKLFELF